MKTFNKILYGGDYNPNQWSREIWNEDMRLFSEANIDTMNINVFSWAKIQPSEEVYDFAELDDIMEMLAKEKHNIILCTSTGAMPAWMVTNYPEVARTDSEGRKHNFGNRHNFCPNSLVYQKYAQKLALKLAERYGDNPQLCCWHVNNEYSGECHCDNCTKAFRVWLKERYQTLDRLNEAWNTDFWSHNIYDWNQIVLPNALSEARGGGKFAFAGMALDYKRFNSDSLLNNFILERDAIRVYDKETPITTNMMGTYKNLDYFKWAKEMDIISWDNYPANDTPWSSVAMNHDLMRGLKDQPFMLMEQTPSQQNWHPYCSLKKPGQLRAQSYQTVAHGADTIQYFQLRKSVGGCEKFHGAVIEHAGTSNTRVFREVQAIGQELASFGSQLIDAENMAEVGILFDWENYWGLELAIGPNKDVKYVDQVHQYYRYFYDNNIPVHMIPVDADFSKYKVIVAPGMYMIREGMKEALEGFVQQGGVLVTNFMSGMVNESDNVHLGGYPGPLREMTGIWVEEIDALAPTETNGVRLANGHEGSCNLISELIHLEGAESLGEYTSNFYKGMPVATKNDFGKGLVYHIGAQLEASLLDEILSQVSVAGEITSIIAEKTNLEISCRKKDDTLYYFIMNLTQEEQPIPTVFTEMTDLLSSKIIESDRMLKQFDVFVVSTKSL